MPDPGWPIRPRLDPVGSAKLKDTRIGWLGDWGGTMSFEGADFRFEAPSVPGVGGLEMIVEGQFTDTGFSGTYTITGLAEGTLEIDAATG